MVLVLCPLPIELKLLHKALMNEGLAFKNDQGTFVSENLTLALGGHGKVNFALTSLNLILKHKPSLLICAGAAGGIQGLEIFDVVAATKTVEHDYSIKFIKKELPSFEGDSDSLKKLKGVKKVIVASGDEDIMDSKRAEEIHKKTQAQAVAWEGAGGAKACAFTKTPFLELRCITDLCNDDPAADFKLNLAAGMSHLAKVIASFLQS